jgi:hypothetical protein
MYVVRIALTWRVPGRVRNDPRVWAPIATENVELRRPISASFAVILSTLSHDIPDYQFPRQ